jgi:hypothetical protein
MDTVNESKLNPQYILRDSESIHLNNLISTGILLKPNSKKTFIDKIVVKKIETDVII